MKENIYVKKEYEAVFYISKDFFKVENGALVPTKNFLNLSFEELRQYILNIGIENVGVDFIDVLRRIFVDYYNSFYPANRIEGEKYIIAESKLFKIAIADNEWAYAILLLNSTLNQGGRGTFFKGYEKNLETFLFSMFPEIGFYEGPTKHKIFTRKDWWANNCMSEEDYCQLKRHSKSAMCWATCRNSCKSYINGSCCCDIEFGEIVKCGYECEHYEYCEKNC